MEENNKKKNKPLTPKDIETMFHTPIEQKSEFLKNRKKFKNDDNGQT